MELSSDGLVATAVPAPGMDTQRAIADYLDTETARIDALIVKKRELSQLLALPGSPWVTWRLRPR